MIRSLNVYLALVVIILISVVYNIRYQEYAYVKDIQTFKNNIKIEKNSQEILDAEWVSLNNPARLEMLARQELDLKPVQFSQIIKFPDELQFGNIVPVSSHLFWK